MNVNMPDFRLGQSIRISFFLAQQVNVVFGDEIIHTRKGGKSVHTVRHISCLYKYVVDNILRLSEEF